MTNERRMYLQELALLSLVRRGEAHERTDITGKTIYKLDCEDPWTPTPKHDEKRKVIPQVELHTGF